MKKILCLSSVLTVLTTTGCLVSEDRRHGYYRGHERYERHREVIVVDPPPVERPPVIEVRPPEIIVR